MSQPYSNLMSVPANRTSLLAAPRRTSPAGAAEGSANAMELEKGGRMHDGTPRIGHEKVHWFAGPDSGNGPRPIPSCLRSPGLLALDSH